MRDIMPIEIPEQILIRRQGAPLRVHPSNFAYTRSDLYSNLSINQPANKICTPNESIDKVFFLDPSIGNYNFNRDDMVRVMVIPFHREQEQVLGYESYMSLHSFSELVKKGRIGQNGEIINTDFVFASWSPSSQLRLLDTEDPLYLAAIRDQANSNIPNLKNKNLIPKHLYRFKNNEVKMFISRVRVAGKIKYLFYNSQNYRLNLWIEGRLQTWHFYCASNPKIQVDLGLVQEVDPELLTPAVLGTAIRQRIYGGGEYHYEYHDLVE